MITAIKNRDFKNAPICFIKSACVIAMTADEWSAQPLKNKLINNLSGRWLIRHNTIFPVKILKIN